jgi:starch-binding outer membrane protein, SusD/RagB family
MRALMNLVVLLVLMMFTGCSDFLEEDPKTFTNPQSLMKSRSGVEQAVNGIYNAGHSLYTTRSIHLMTTINTDESWAPLYVTGDRWEMMAYTFNPTNPNINTAYVAYVTAINRANMVLDNLPAVGTLGIPDEKVFLNYKRGEALVLRAWYYFKHMSTFGNVPLITTFNDFELKPRNTPIPEIYKQIIADLKEAETILPNWQDKIAEPGRINRGAAKSLLGIVYLTKATSEAKEGTDFQNAASKLKEVIDTEGYDLWAAYKDAFIPANKNKKEDIFSQQAQVNTSFASVMYSEFVPHPAPTGASRAYALAAITEVLYKSYEAGDKRLGMYITGDYVIRSTGIVQKAVYPYHFHEKFLDPVNGPLSYNNFSTNMPLIRFADVLLSYSEAVNASNSTPSSEAYSGINRVRARAGLSGLSGLSKEQFFDEIVKERARELFCEGVRWFDLKRWGLLKKAENKGESAPNINNIKVELPKHSVFPFPQVELDANPNLTQNPGY